MQQLYKAYFTWAIVHHNGNPIPIFKQNLLPAVGSDGDSGPIDKSTMGAVVYEIGMLGTVV